MARPVVAFDAKNPLLVPKISFREKSDPLHILICYSLFY